MSDVNKVWLTGVVVSTPVLTKLSSQTPVSTFTLQSNEQFRDKNGFIQVKPNLIRIESLGKSAEATIQKVRQGARFSVDGYLRQDMMDGREFTRVRTFAVYPDESAETANFKQGIKQALEIIRKSRDIATAQSRLEELLEI